MRWAVHVGPGTGKSHVLNRLRKELFEDILGWKQGDEFQVVTLQAVMANDLKGDTIHHAFGLNWQGLGDERISGHKLLELSAKALRWRWLIIDEISMVSAELLARLELRCRELVRDLAQGKYIYLGYARTRPVLSRHGFRPGFRPRLIPAPGWYGLLSSFCIASTIPMGHLPKRFHVAVAAATYHLPE